ncbi:MAG: hypothetical protein CSB48_09290 [Proteobacteria bacterium]|nr:MAG: hypothetical protein CSB48_09290 [Pseudomonadota bacterium]PIE39981.1 MAG: hypothetical protein CSA51_03165 [Gammaproteobacteria bacterium]
MPPFLKIRPLSRVTGLLLLVSLALEANQLTRAEKKTIHSHSGSQQSQQRINSIEAELEDSRARYLGNERMADVTETYNRQMSLLIESQQRELADLRMQLKSIEETDQAVLPMLNQMLDTLQRFVKIDMPFLPDERHTRLKKLEQLLLRADVSVAEKYRQIVEAYMIEVQYGSTFEAYSGKLDINDDQRQVSFLRLGRTALYFQTLNGKEGGQWLPAESRWQPLTESQNLALRKAIQIARQQQVPGLIKLPLPSPEPRS